MEWPEIWKALGGNDRFWAFAMTYNNVFLSSKQFPAIHD